MFERAGTAHCCRHCGWRESSAEGFVLARPELQRIWTHKRRNVAAGTESGQIGTQMVSLFTLINQAAANPQRAKTAPSGADANRNSNWPLPSIAISQRGGRRDRQISAVATASRPARTACITPNESARAALIASATAVIPASELNTCRRCRSRCDGASSVHGTSTCRRGYSRLNTSVPFVPPKPNEFFSATSIRISRATFAQ